MAMNPVNAYRQTRVKTASQGKIIVMLYDEAIRQIDIAKQAIDNDTRQYDQVNNAIGKAQDIITELMVSLDFEKGGDFAQSLFNLYMFFNNQLMEANLGKDAQPLQKVRGFLAELREAWQQAAEKTGNDGGGSGASGQGGINIAG